MYFHAGCYNFLEQYYFIKSEKRYLMRRIKCQKVNRLSTLFVCSIDDVVLNQKKALEAQAARIEKLERFAAR